MKIFNISDVSTSSLVKHGLVSQTFSIGGQLLKPGMYVIVDDSKKKIIGAQVRHLLKFGAIAIDKPPASYKPAPSVPGQNKTPPAPAPDAPTAQASKAAAPKKAG